MVFQHYHKQFEFLLLLDIDAGGCLEGCSYRFIELSATRLASLLTLRPPRRIRAPFSIRQRRRPNSRLAVSREAEEAFAGLPMERTLVVLGSAHDPFAAIGSRFQLGIELLKRIAEAQPAAVCVQTNSPLVMLATPITRSLGARAAVTIALEACSPSFAALQAPGTARPEERLETARTLRDAGIITVLQLAPVTDKAHVRNYVRAVISSGRFATIADAYADAELCELVRRELIRRAPDMLLENISDIWSAPAVESEAA